MRTQQAKYRHRIMSIWLTTFLIELADLAFIDSRDNVNVMCADGTPDLKCSARRGQDACL
jgi:hypothetical protein